MQKFRTPLLGQLLMAISSTAWARLDPDKPTVLTMYNSFCIPGMPVKEQTCAARMRRFALSYADVEKAIKVQFTKMFAAGGFDAERDIAGIVLNRQGHAYVVCVASVAIPSSSGYRRRYT